jgi:hypothetical protein
VPVTLFSLSSDMATLGEHDRKTEKKLELVAIGFLGADGRGTSPQVRTRTFVRYMYKSSTASHVKMLI